MNEVDAYFKSLPVEARKTLERLRARLRELLPDATEGIYYRMPAFRLEQPVVAYAAFKNHCSLFPLGAAVPDELGEAAEPYRTTMGTLQFPVGGALPKGLVKKIVKARVAEIKQEARERPAKHKSRSER